jgi:small-conductance mechanosensitive channel
LLSLTAWISDVSWPAWLQQDPAWLVLLQWAGPLFLLLLSFQLGRLLENTLYGRLVRFSEKLPVPAIGKGVLAFRGMIFLWTVLFVANATLALLPLSAELAAYVGKLLTVAFLLSAVVVFARVFVQLVEAWMQRFSSVFPSTSIFTIVTYTLVYSLGFLVILQTVGISITPLLTALGVGGLAISLAFQDTLSNLFAGVQVLISQQVKPGNHVQLENGEEGYVVDINWRNTTIRHIYNYLIIVPNTKLASAIVRNHHYPQQAIRAVFGVGVAYDSDLEQVEQVTVATACAVAEDFAGADKSFKPFIRFHTFNDFSIDLDVHFQVREYFQQIELKHRFVKALHKAYAQAGITIPFPIRTLDFSAADLSTATATAPSLGQQ